MAGKGNKENLKHLSSDEARMNGSKGGRASVQSRRRKKTMREALEQLLFHTKLNEQTKKMLEAEGVENADDFNHQMVITRSLIAKAESGDVQAYNAICSMIGEKPAEKMDLSGSTQNELVIRHITQSPDDVNFPSSESEVDAER
jgi:hypothetical protein